jgi:predicted dinucleotide-binding enzyme
MTAAIIGTGGIGSIIARQLASGGETLRLSSSDSESARTRDVGMNGTAGLRGAVLTTRALPPRCTIALPDR